MRVFRPTYRDKGSGERREGSRWWIEVKDHRGLSRRFPAFPEKAASLALGRRIESLVVCRMNHEQPGRELSRWLERASGKLLDRLTRFDLLDGTRSAAGKRLSEHLADFRQSLLSKGDTPGQACQVARRAEKVFAACGFTTWTDLRADRVERCLADLRSGPKGLSAQTSNGYLQAVKQFARWMIENRRALESPVAHLKALNVRTDRRHDRTYLEVEEMRRLLQATRRGPVRFGMDGNERAMLYQVAAETGLRRGELASLKVSSFDLDRQTVTVVARDSGSPESVLRRQDATRQSVRRHVQAVDAEDGRYAQAGPGRRGYQLHRRRGALPGFLLSAAYVRELAGGQRRSPEGCPSNHAAQ